MKPCQKNLNYWNQIKFLECVIIFKIEASSFYTARAQLWGQLRKPFLVLTALIQRLKRQKLFKLFTIFEEKLENMYLLNLLSSRVSFLFERKTKFRICKIRNSNTGWHRFDPSGIFNSFRCIQLLFLEVHFLKNFLFTPLVNYKI